MTTIAIEQVSRRFGRVVALDGASFHVGDGEAVALWGSNGAGKTTLVRCVLGILRHRGRVRVGGLDSRRHGKRARALVGYVPQELAFHDDMRLGPAVAFFARLRGADRSRCAAMLEQVGLAGHEGQRVRDLSGGMKQRLALAVAMLGDPPVAILDEPTSNLDMRGRRQVVETLRGLKASGKTILFASHRPEEVAGIADRVIVLERGRIVRDATPTELWPSLGASLTLRLRLDGAAEADAACVLRDAGCAVHLNGNGLCVSVPADRKAEPIAALGAARMNVLDFEVVDADAGMENAT